MTNHMREYYAFEDSFGCTYSLRPALRPNNVKLKFEDIRRHRIAAGDACLRMARRGAGRGAWAPQDATIVTERSQRCAGNSSSRFGG